MTPKTTQLTEACIWHSSKYCPHLTADPAVQSVAARMPGPCISTCSRADSRALSQRAGPPGRWGSDVSNQYGGRGGTTCHRCLVTHTKWPPPGGGFQAGSSQIFNIYSVSTSGRWGRGLVDDFPASDRGHQSLILAKAGGRPLHT